MKLKQKEGKRRDGEKLHEEKLTSTSGTKMASAHVFMVYLLLGDY